MPGQPPARRPISKRLASTEQPAAEPDILALQRGRFITWQPSPVLCGAVTGDGSVAAVGREDGQIELWDTLSWQLLKKIPGSARAAPSALAWLEQQSASGPVDRRLVSGSLDGTLTEWDLTILQPAAVTDSGGGAVWAIATQPAATHPEDGGPALAVACDDGVLRLFGAGSSAEVGMQFRRTFGRVQGRVLSVAWHPSGLSLATGHSDGCIRAWDTETTQEIYRITACREGCVWAVAVLPDGTICSGESSGRVRFWDGATGTLIADFREHDGNVLAVAASPDGRTVFASGVDSRIAVFHLVSSSEGPEFWEYQDLKRPHTHDVRMLLTLPMAGEAPLLLSGGHDAQLLAHSANEFMKHHPTRVCALPQRPITCIAVLPPPQRSALPASAATSNGRPTANGTARGAVANGTLGSHSDSDSDSGTAGEAAEEGVLILSASAARLDFWRLPSPSAIDQETAVHSEPIHLARINNKNGHHILAAAIAVDGSRIAFSDAYHTRVLKLSQGPSSLKALKGRLSFSRVRPPQTLPPAHHLSFTSTGSLALSAADGSVMALQLGDQSASLQASSTQPPTSSGGSSSKGSGVSPMAREALLPPVAALSVSPAGDMVVTGGRGTLHFYSLTSQAASPKWLGRAVVGGGTPTAVAWTADGSQLAVATAGVSAWTVEIIDVATRRQSVWSSHNGSALQRSLDKVPGTIIGLSLTSQPGTAGLLISLPHAFALVDLQRPLGRALKHKRRRQAAYVKPEDAAVAAAQVDNFTAGKLKHPSLFMAFTAPGCALLLEHYWSDTLTSLLPPLYRRRYGT